jgi:hypothetical protein
MSEVTLEIVQAKQAELADLIARLTQPAATSVSLPAVAIDLRQGERYAGAVLDENGSIKHHLILMPAKPGKRLDWKAALAWATGVGGDRPTRQEQALLYANCKPHLDADWHWSSEANGDEYAWCCYFGNGGQSCGHQSGEGLAVAVRRLNP